jgi:hypothetical protein
MMGYDSPNKMKIILWPLLFMCVFSLPLFSQTKMTDRDLMKLKGPVKTLQEDFEGPRGSNANASEMVRQIFGITFFDEGGMITEIQYPSSKRKLVFALVDGFKTFRTIEPEVPVASGGRVTFYENEPIEKPERLTEPDARFDHKYVYEYDKAGRIVTERQYLNNGKMFSLRKFEYDREGRLSAEVENTTVAINRYRYKFDDNGVHVETNRDRDIKRAGVDSKQRKIYSDYKFDSHGNWVERKVNTFYSDKGNPTFKVPPSKWEIETYEYRTLSYFEQN